MHHKHDENTRTLQPHSRSDFALEDDEEQDPSGIHDGFLTDVSASSTSQSDYPKSPSTDDKDNPETNDGPDQQQRAVIALDATYPGDVEEMYRLLFKSKLMHRFLSKYEGCRGRTANFQYIVQLYGFDYAFRYPVWWVERRSTQIIIRAQIWPI